MTDKQQNNINILPLAEQVNASIHKQTKVQDAEVDNWSISVFFGPLPSLSNGLSRLGYTACAKTQDIKAGPEPDISNTDGVRVDFDSKSIIWWSGESLETLTKKITTAFPEITWGQKEIH